MTTEKKLKIARDALKEISDQRYFETPDVTIEQIAKDAYVALQRIEGGDANGSPKSSRADVETGEGRDKVDWEWIKKCIKQKPYDGSREIRKAILALNQEKKENCNNIAQLADNQNDIYTDIADLKTIIDHLRKQVEDLHNNQRDIAELRERVDELNTEFDGLTWDSVIVDKLQQRVDALFEWRDKFQDMLMDHPLIKRIEELEKWQEGHGHYDPDVLVERVDELEKQVWPNVPPHIPEGCLCRYKKDGVREVNPACKAKHEPTPLESEKCTCQRFREECEAIIKVAEANCPECHPIHGKKEENEPQPGDLVWRTGGVDNKYTWAVSVINEHDGYVRLVKPTEIRELRIAIEALKKIANNRNLHAWLRQEADRTLSQIDDRVRIEREE